MKSILIKLNQIQSSLVAPKGQMNKFGNYKYRSAEDVLEAVKPHLKTTNTVLTVADKIILIGERYYIEATATLWDCESEESINNTAFAREEEIKKGMDSSQITGSVSSYARKYALNGLLAIDDTKDSDSTNTHGKEPVVDTQADMPASEKVDTKQIISEVQAQALLQLALDTKSSVSDLCKYYEVKDLNELNMEQFMGATKILVKRQTK